MSSFMNLLTVCFVLVGIAHLSKAQCQSTQPDCMQYEVPSPKSFNEIRDEIMSWYRQDCNDVYANGFTDSGIYDVTIAGNRNVTSIYCDMTTDGGKWLVFQRRKDGSVDFYRNWTEYERGFGQLDGEFWLGLDLLHSLTISRPYLLRVDLEDWDGNTSYAIYRVFMVKEASTNFRLMASGYYGEAGDSLVKHNNQPFSTKDRDNDNYDDRHCAQLHGGGWWYHSCGDSNLNGRYIKQEGDKVNRDGLVWFTWKGSHHALKKVEMKIRPHANLGGGRSLSP